MATWLAAGGAALLAITAATPPAAAQDASLPDLVVTAPRATADAASEIRLDTGQIAARPIARIGEALEEVPGLIVTQHSGEGKRTSTSSAASTWTTAPTSPSASTACRSTCAPMRVARAMATSIS